MFKLPVAIENANPEQKDNASKHRAQYGKSQSLLAQLLLSLSLVATGTVEKDPLLLSSHISDCGPI